MNHDLPLIARFFVFFSQAHFLIGEFYESGKWIGQEKDLQTFPENGNLKEALKHFEIAAGKGNLKAKMKIAKSYLIFFFFVVPGLEF